MSRGLTERQKEILGYIVGSIRERGFPPTMVEIGEKFHISSLNGVNDHLKALERKGYIRRSSKARDIHVTSEAAASLYGSRAEALPLVGRVAAGQPLLAEENVEDHVVVSSGLAKPGAFCLKVNGDSMIEDGILSGDVVIVDPTIPARAGDTVVALLEDEATVKRYYPHGAKVELRPANSAMQPIYVAADTVRVQGVVVALQRSLR